jgi:uncharacterized caspase-like protein
MTGLKAILAAMAIAGIFSTSLGEAQRAEKMHSGASSTCCATEASKQWMHSHASRLALVIGNSSYPDADAPLAQTVNDASAFAIALRKDGFDVYLVQNATRDDMTHAIFGGFGIQSDGQSYMLPVDAKIWYEDDVRRDGISIDRLLSELKNSGAYIRLAVIDASRRNPYERRFRSYTHGLAPIEAGKNALILTSMPPSEVVDDSRGSHSVLITALLNEMDSSTDSVEKIFDDTRLAVTRKTQNQQIPAVSSAPIDDVKLGPAPTNAVVSSHRSFDRRT